MCVLSESPLCNPLGPRKRPKKDGFETPLSSFRSAYASIIAVKQRYRTFNYRCETMCICRRPRLKCQRSTAKDMRIRNFKKKHIKLHFTDLFILSDDGEADKVSRTPIKKENQTI